MDSIFAIPALVSSLLQEENRRLYFGVGPQKTAQQQLDQFKLDTANKFLNFFDSDNNLNQFSFFSHNNFFKNHLVTDFVMHNVSDSNMSATIIDFSVSILYNENCYSFGIHAFDLINTYNTSNALLVT